MHHPSVGAFHPNVLSTLGCPLGWWCFFFLLRRFWIIQFPAASSQLHPSLHLGGHPLCFRGIKDQGCDKHPSLFVGIPISSQGLLCITIALWRRVCIPVSSQVFSLRGGTCSSIKCHAQNCLHPSNIPGLLPFLNSSPAAGPRRGLVGIPAASHNHPGISKTIQKVF